MSKTLIEKKFLKHTNVIDSIDKTMKKTFWEKNSLLKVFKNNLQELRQYIFETLEIENYMNKSRVTGLNSTEDTVGQLKVFILLYNTEGEDLDKWAIIVKSLIGKTISRPVYRVEDDIKSMINSKDNILNEGYVIAYINNNDLIADHKEDPKQDELGNELSILKDNCIKRRNIIEFIHNSESYVFEENKLIPSSLT